MKMNNPNELSIFIRNFREKNKKTQAYVAHRIGIRQATLSNLEKQSEYSEIITLFKVINELGLELHLIDKKSNKMKNLWNEEW